MANLKKNLTYQTVYQILNTCIPLITSPYLARVLGASKQGIFSYTQSIVNFFVLFAMMGISTYGTRVIATCRSRNERSINFWNIYILQFFISLISISCYILYLALFNVENNLIAEIQGLYLLGTIIDINWLFFGIERFEVTVKRNIVVRLLSVISILALVNKPSDLWIYTLIMSGSVVISNAVLWGYLPRVVTVSDITKSSVSEIIKHIRPNIALFIPLLAMSIYHIMDKTMLGFLSTYEQTGFYYNADKIINIPNGIIYGIGMVMLPRMSMLADIGDENKSNIIFKNSVELIIMISTAMAFGIAAISKEFTPIFFGPGFDDCIILIIVLSPVLIIKSLSQTYRMQLLIPNHKERIFIQSVFLGALTNLVSNILLIPRFGALGAVIGTLLAESVTCLWQYYKMRKYIDINGTLLTSSYYLIAGLLMFGCVRAMASILPTGIIGLGLEIVFGAIIFGVICIIIWKMTQNKYLDVLLSYFRKTRKDK